MIGNYNLSLNLILNIINIDLHLGKSFSYFLNKKDLRKAKYESQGWAGEWRNQSKNKKEIDGAGLSDCLSAEKNAEEKEEEILFGGAKCNFQIILL